MTDTAAISGTRRQYKEMADGTLRVQIDIDPQFKQQFLELFGSIDMPVAIAPLKADFEKAKEPEKLKGGPLSKSAAQMCEVPEFQEFLTDVYGAVMSPHYEPSTVELLRFICGVQSRAELDHNLEAAKRFHTLMGEYRSWMVEA